MHGRKWLGFGAAEKIVAGIVVFSLAADAQAAGGVTAEAVAGRPFGVATISLPPSADVAALAEINGFALVERDGRALYPSFTAGRIRRVLADVLSIELKGPTALSVSFLFTGDEPLHVTLYAPQPIVIDIVPRREQRAQETAEVRLVRNEKAHEILVGRGGRIGRLVRGRHGAVRRDKL